MSLSIGLVIGGTVTVSAIWFVSGLGQALPTAGKVLALVLLGAAAIARDAGLIRFHILQSARQVPKTVFRNGTVLGPLRFGLELGTGVLTYAPATFPYLLAVAIFLLSPPYSVAVMAGIGFGAGRAMMPVTRILSGHMDRWDEQLDIRAKALAVSCCTCGLAALLAAAPATI